MRPLQLLVPCVLLAFSCNDPPAPTTTSPSASASVAATLPTTSAAVEPSAVPSAEPNTDADAGAAPRTSASAASGKPDAGAKPGKDAGTASSTDAGAAPEPTTASADAGPAPPLEAPAAGSADAVAAEVDKIFVGRKTFSAKFKQEYTQKVSGNVKKSTGSLLVEKPNKISFRYDPPNKNRIVSDGTLLKVYVADDSQMFVSPVGNTEYPGALAFIMGKGLRPSFTFTFNENAKKTYTAGPVLTGKPRQATPHYESVFFYVDQALLEKGDPGVIRRVLVVDAQGNRNRFDFEGSSTPGSIEASEFTFTPPEGTNVTKP